MPPPLRLTDVRLVREGRTILAPARPGRWPRASAGSCWAPTGAARRPSSRSPALYLHPTSGTVEVLGETLGRCDVRHRAPERIGLASAALAAQLRPQLSALDTVMTATYAALEPWWHRYTERGPGGGPERPWPGWGSTPTPSGPWGRCRPASSSGCCWPGRSSPTPGLVLLDEPTARLDLGGREAMVAALAELARDPSAPPMVMVTHHVDEIPPGFDHALVLREGRVLAAGAARRRR